MPRRTLDQDVFSAAIDRLVARYEAGDRMVLSFSAGKDSGVCLELMIVAATITGRLPVDVIMRDEEVMLPGTYEYAERVAARPEVSFHWVIANQPIVNVFDRHRPYWWVFDPLLQPEDWVRQPPDYSYTIPEKNILALITADRFPVQPGQDLVEVVGLRTQESAIRRAGLHSSGGYMTKPNERGVRKCRPIYDWTDGDVWKAIKDNRWDYNHAYDTMYRMGMKRASLRIGPPTLSYLSIPTLDIARRAWPRWFDRVARRLPGVRTAAQFGVRAVTPARKLGETWEQTFWRECVQDAPDWVAARSRTVAEHFIARHSQHATHPLPDARPCPVCSQSMASWKKLALNMYNGNPFSLKIDTTVLPYVEPEFFRPGSGTWGGKPSW